MGPQLRDAGGEDMIKCICGWWYLVNAGAFHGYPFPTKQDAAEALQAIKQDKGAMTCR